MTTPVPDDTDPQTPPAGRWMRYIGQADAIVEHIGAWAVGEAKHVEGWLAARLLGQPDFEETDPPAPVPAAASDPIPNAGALMDTVDAVLSVEPSSDTPADPAETPAKPARRARTTN